MQVQSVAEGEPLQTFEAEGEDGIANELLSLVSHLDRASTNFGIEISTDK